MAEYVTYRQCEDSGQGALEELISQCPEVVDLAYATTPQTSHLDPIRDIQENLPRSLGLFRLAVRSATRKLILVSSGGTVYGKVPHVPIDERQSTNPLCPYGVTKLAIEKYAGLFHAIEGLPVVILRPSTAYGEGQEPYRGQGVVSTIIGSLRDDRPITLFGGTSIVRDFIHAQDVASAVQCALDSGVAGACYNVGTGVGCGLQQVLEMIGVVGGMEIDSSKVTLMPERPFDVQWNVLDSSLLRDQTGWRPEVTLVDGLRRTWAAMQTGTPGWQHAWCRGITSHAKGSLG
jgi:UDP-glucose 4-epimerase